MEKKATALVRIGVNGKVYEKRVHTSCLLIDFLRYDLALTGTKLGCSVGMCGACTVLMDGRMISSCLTLAVMADGSEVTTVEGLTQDERLLAMQKAFAEYGGFQCGVCTPGQIVAAKTLLDINPHPTEEEIKDWMMSNLCRCTGYYGILRSIQSVAQLD